MSTKRTVDALWQEFRQVINAAYKNGQTHSISTEVKDDFTCLHDYVEDMTWHDDLAALVGREAANEQQHRKNDPPRPGFSIDTAAKLMIMENARKGAEMAELTRATAFLVFRQTAVEAEVIGWIIRDYLDPVWREKVAGLDYAKLMQEARDVVA